MSIRYADTHAALDLDQLAALFCSVGWHYRTADPERFKRMIANTPWVVSAWDGDHLVGFCRAITDEAFNAYVTTVAVRPDYQRRGIGRELMRRLMAGRDHMLFVLRADPEHHAFYGSLGFAAADNMFRRPRSG